MRSGFTAHVTAAEWRWVMVVSFGLVLLAFAPFLIVALNSGANSGWQFMGILHNSRDGATYLSKMTLGVNGDWLVRFQHTPEPHNSAFIQVLYPFLGQIAALLDVSVLVVYHVARALAALFMYLALYQLAATIWMRIRTRRIFFVLVSLGTGFGWIYALATNGGAESPDLLMPESFPFYSSLVNVHFPLTIACLSLMAGIIIEAFRPGVEDEPRLGNNGLAAVLFSLLVSLLYPQALVPLGAALAVFVVLRWWRRRALKWRDFSWALVIILPVVPMAVYYGAIVTYNPAMAEWTQQNVTPTPGPLVMLVGLGLPLLIAVPGLYHAARQFESHDDRFMLIWLVAILVIMYVPTTIQRRFAVGLMIPISYFATRAVEAIWFQWLSRRRWRYRILVLALPFVALTNVFVLFVPTLPVLINRPDQSEGLFLASDYGTAFAWLVEQGQDDEVVLASQVVSLWLPGWAQTRVVHGHPFETLDASNKAQQVTGWYAGEADCRALLDDYDVAYVLYGPEEAELGTAPCLDDLEEVYRSGEVIVYAT